MNAGNTFYWAFVEYSLICYPLPIANKIAIAAIKTTPNFTNSHLNEILYH